ncbi:MAG: DoxX family protein [Phycisphaerales bacterium]|nr:DoxX family protein [Phycisphaerales bacterium]
MTAAPHGFVAVVGWVARILAAVILLQTLFFKFSGSAESVYIFSTLGVEPWGRWLSGVAELAAAVLLLIPSTGWLGALLGLGIMLGAIASHLTRLGIVVHDDGGLLFALALTVSACCAIVAWIDRRRFLRQIRV